uniref:Uncharacterized protein n=1 Tax=Anguilla anguilla TaxID=7936 RepID=A0A0E9UZB8_ANGAN
MFCFLQNSNSRPPVCSVTSSGCDISIRMFS